MSGEPDAPEVSMGTKLRAVSRAFRYRPGFAVLIVVFGCFAALFEAIGLTFLIPIIEIAQSDGDPVAEAEGIMLAFVRAYEFLGVPFTLEFIIVGVTVVIATRYTLSFLVAWIREMLRANYVETLQSRGFRAALTARTSYYDAEGSDEILNAIVTQAVYGGKTIKHLVRVFEKTLLCLVYFGIACYIAPVLTIAAVGTLGGITVLVRRVLEPGYTVGDRVTAANERIQSTVQAGTQGSRDVKLFGIRDELLELFDRAVDTFVDASIDLRRNEAAIRNFYQLAAAVSIFGLIYGALRFLDLSFATLGVFLFATFQLAPQIGELNQLVYRLEGDLPHLVRTHRFTDDLERRQEPTGGTRDCPDAVDRIEFQEVSFSYGDERVLSDVSFEVRDGEFVALVGPSGAGKSTIVSLLARFYEPDDGRITVDGTALEDVPIDEWRDSIAVVRQDPHIFNETLRFNLTIGNREATEAELDRVCEMAQVTPFLEELPNGYETVLGDDGVRLSGGQRQRVALARALLVDADVLILDEATSDLDSELERRIHRAIESVEDEYTIIAIAHRLSTVTNADRIHTLEDGAIVETGDHDSLLQHDGMYAQLYAIQSD
ncbi:multidrug ABC transporter permease [Natrinema saccharevitans]|uniref:Multidrug ABC transporter permease n=1 Tax=Natrinema saccharevitans TaxID=301967 RepID=A0A1S8ARY9_9EURY|nr:ABC transporter ATP-binding protein [Natrinema saccharevitans]OLZ39515.1 multidrug ABC transporter permease [Natrinema saccharevitans]